MNPRKQSKERIGIIAVFSSLTSSYSFLLFILFATYFVDKYTINMLLYCKLFHVIFEITHNHSNFRMFKFLISKINEDIF